MGGVKASGQVVEIFWVFLRLGLTSFGGPIAHLGYFHTELVVRRRWVSESQFAQLLAICQFLPGPASSQLGFSLGLLKGGWAGAVAAFVAFTLPSVILLLAFAALLPVFADPIGLAAIHGLKIVALAVVAQAALGLARQLCPEPITATIAGVSVVVLLLVDDALIQLVVVAGGAMAGAMWLQPATYQESTRLDPGYSVRWGGGLLAVFVLLLLGLPWLAQAYGGPATVADGFYRAGALVFGGGHVVLPLLEEVVVGTGSVSPDLFLAGYGAAQAVPGPLFSFAAYLGAVLPGSQGGLSGALLAVLFIFLPGFLLVAAVLPLWQQLAAGRLTAAAVAGVNAAVVGLLLAALYDPIFITAITGPVDLAIACIAFLIIAVWRLSALYAVAWCVLASVAMMILFR